MCAGGSIPSWTAKYPIVNPPMGKSKDSFSSEANAEIADWPFQTSRSCHFTLSVIPLGFQLHGGCPDSERSVAEQPSESSLLELAHANPDGFFLKGVAAASLIVIREKKILLIIYKRQSFSSFVSSALLEHVIVYAYLVSK